ncbi:MAG: aspartate kinase [Lentisphaerae bacterium]|nr:aspartate kinase [Lentisphaerota bacterium]
MKVCKFGGSSLADAGCVRRVCDIVLSDPDRRIVVVSAPGKGGPHGVKVTDLLIACAETSLEGREPDEELRMIVDRFAGIQEELGLAPGLVEGVASDLADRVGADRANRPRYVDTLKAAGEDHCARFVAAELTRRGADARYVSPKDAGLLLTDEYGNAQLLPESYENLAALRDAGHIVVFPGFFGTTRAGDVVTFPRGGSDITGSILAAAVGAEVYENFTDVDGVFSVDPRIVPHARPIEELTYREMRELAYGGFGVLHDEAIVPAVRAGVPIQIRNTETPDEPGTRIVPERTHGGGSAVGIAADAGFCTVFVGKYLMNREVGFGRRLLQLFEDEGLSYEHMPSGIDNASIILREAGFDESKEARVVQRLQTDLGATDVWVERGLALVMIVGEGLRYALGMAALATKALADAGVNIEMMNKGASEISMMFGVKAEDRNRAVEALYEVFFS